MAVSTASTFSVNVRHFQRGDFSNWSILGEGREGAVYRATHNTFGKVAVKTLSPSVNVNDINEIQILVQCRHNHIVVIYGILRDEYESERCAGYVMELMEEGSLSQVIHGSKQYDVKHVYKWIEQIGHGLNYLHEQNIIHRDVKPNNILVVSIDHLKLADFGYARKVAAGMSITTGLGTCLYMAPEVIQTRRYDKSADIYSFAISIWEMIHRLKPYSEFDSEYKLCNAVIDGKRPLLDLSRIDQEMKLLLQRGWNEKPAERVTIGEMIEFAKRKNAVNTEGTRQLMMQLEKNVSPFSVNVRHFQRGDLSNYSILSGGREAMVYRATHNTFGKVAVKRLSRSVHVNDINEIQILIQYRHNHIVAIFGILRDEDKPERCAGYVMELMEEGNLSKVIHGSKQYDVKHVYKWIEQIGHGLNYLHKHNIIHRDVKPNKKPYSEFDSEYKLCNAVIDGKRPLLDLSRIDPEMETLLQRGWNDDPTKRVTTVAMIEFAKRKSGVNKEETCPEALQPTILTATDDKMFIVSQDKSNWKTLSFKLPPTLLYGGFAYLNGEIFTFGGDEFKKKTYKYGHQKGWIPLADMNDERHNISNSTVVFEGCIWVFGGEGEIGNILNTVEKYIPEEDKWKQMPKMQDSRYDAAAAVCDGKFYVSGGDDDGILNSVECFDPKTSIWTMFVKLPSPLRGHSLISDGSSLIVLGGCDGQKYCNTVCKINPNEENPSWKTMPSMMEDHHLFSAISLENRIYAIGGEYNKTVEIFNGDSWEAGPNLPESHLPVSVVIPSHLATALLSL